MNPQSLERQIAKISSSGDVAAPNTWISSYVVTKKSGKSYKYYRLMTNVRDSEGKLRQKMVKYLGSEGSQAHKKMMGAIARRNRIQELSRQLKRLQEQEKSKNKQRIKRYSPCNAPLTNNDRKLLLKLQHLFEKMMKPFEELQAQIKQLKSQNL